MAMCTRGRGHHCNDDYRVATTNAAFELVTAHVQRADTLLLGERRGRFHLMRSPATDVAPPANNLAKPVAEGRD